MNLIGSSLSCKRDGKLIFSDLSFKIKSGDVCFIKGPNGSGKSTLLRLLAGFIKVWTGKISLNNEDISNRNDIIYNNFFYIGALGSKKTHENRCNRLEQAGYSKKEVDRRKIGFKINRN